MSQVNQERPFEFTMNTSTWFKKCFNQDFIFCKYMLPSEYELFISMSLFWARLSFGLKRCPAFPASFSSFIWFTSMTLGDFSLCMSSGRNSPLFRYRWLRYEKLWSSHYTFVEFLLLIAEIILFLGEQKGSLFSLMKIHYKFLSWLANSLYCKIQSKLKNNWKWNCSNFIKNEVKVHCLNGTKKLL